MTPATDIAASGRELINAQPYEREVVGRTVDVEIEIGF
jgi:hypothetical protein